MPFVDLHLHSNHSDGSDPPAAVVERASALGMAALALTDHDTVSGVAEARAAAQAAGIAFLTGVELSARFDGVEIHVLGLGVDPAHPDLLAALGRLAADRIDRADRILARLAEAGIRLDLPALHAQTGAGAVTRMHIAEALRIAGHTRSTQEGFDRFLNPGRPAHVGKTTLPLDEALSLVHAAHGLAFLAHPGLGRTVLKRLAALLAFPFDGIEAWHVSHTPGRVEEFRALALERGLLVSGGSDCHGSIKGRREMGRVQTPDWVYTAIRDRLAA